MSIASLLSATSIFGDNVSALNRQRTPFARLTVVDLDSPIAMLQHLAPASSRVSVELGLAERHDRP
jgi:hypothetical protein